MSKIPQWAQDLTIDTILYLQSQGFKVELPELVWRHGYKFHSSGHCSGKIKVIITAGKNRLDQKLVLLHELAHTVTESEPKYWDIERAKKHGWIFPDGEPDKPIIIQQRCHTDKFWDTAWDLYRYYKLPIGYCKQREGNYKKGALIAYHKSKSK